MKKIVSLCLFVLLLSSVSLFAEDAKVMPARLGRFYMAPTFAFSPGAFDKDGNYSSYGDGAGAVKAFNLGFALEYGVIPWLTAAIQWAPGWTVASDVDRADLAAPAGSSINGNGPADIFLGAKMQIIGETAPVKSSLFRFAVGPGLKIPLPGADFAKQATNMTTGDSVTAANMDYHVFGAGVRLYFDYLINKKFFINLYSEFLFYPVKGKADTIGFQATKLGVIGAAGAGAAAVATALADADVKVNYGYDLTFELEPTFTYTLSPAKPIIFTAGLPINYKTNFGRSYSISGVPAAYLPAFAAFDGDADPTHILSLKPNISFFFVTWKLPTEFELSYSAPVWGQNLAAKHSFTLLVKAYFRAGHAK